MVGVSEDDVLALGVGEDLGSGMLCLQTEELSLGEGLVDDAGALPKEHLPTRILLEPGPKIAVWSEEDGLVFGEGRDDPFRVGRGADHVRERLHSGAAVDVADDSVVGMELLEAREGFSRARV